MIKARYRYKIAIYICICALIISFLSASTAASDELDSLRASVEMYRDRTLQNAREARDALQAWKVSPNSKTQDNYNRLRDEAYDNFAALRKMENAINEAERAGSYSMIIINTLIGSFKTSVDAASEVMNTIGGAISDTSTWLFGASDDELFGPNWQQINSQYASLHERYLNILARKKAAMEKPDNEAEIQAIKAEIEQMRVRYDSLRKTVRIEQRNLGWKAAFWGEEYMGRYIAACVDNFDFMNLVSNAMSLNIKLIYDIFKPAMLLEMGKKYISPNQGGNLTPRIHDALVLDVMGMASAPDASEQFQNFAKGLKEGKIIDTAKAKMMEEYEKKLASEITNLKHPLMNAVKGKLEAEMQDEIMAHISSLPYENLPGGAIGNIDDVMKNFFESKGVRDKYIQKTQDAMKAEFDKVANINVKGKSSALSQKLDAVGSMVDVVSELGTIYSSSPYVDTVLDSANGLAGRIRERYRTMLKEKKIDRYEQTEDEYLNAVWESEWGRLGTNGKKALTEAIKDDQNNINARKGVITLSDNSEKAQEQLDKNALPDSYQLPTGYADAYIQTAQNLDRQMNSNDVTAAEFMSVELQAFEAVSDALVLISDINKKVYDRKLEQIAETYRPQVAGVRAAQAALYPSPNSLMCRSYNSFDKAAWDAASIEERKSLDAQCAIWSEKARVLNVQLDNLYVQQNEEKVKAGEEYQKYVKAVEDESAKFSTERAKWIQTWSERGMAVLDKLPVIIQDMGTLRKKAGEGIFSNGPRSYGTIALELEKVDSSMQARSRYQSFEFISANKNKRGSGLDFHGLTKALFDMRSAQKNIDELVKSAVKDAVSEGDAITAGYRRLIDEASVIVDTEGGWGELYILMAKNNYSPGISYEQIKDVVSPLDVLSLLSQEAIAFSESGQSWIDDAKTLVTDFNFDLLDGWAGDISGYPDAVKKMLSLEDESRQSVTSVNAAVDKAYWILINDRRYLDSSDKELLGSLSAEFSKGGMNEYSAPDRRIAQWMKRLKMNSSSLKKIMEMSLKPDSLRVAVNNYLADIGGFEDIQESIDPAIRAGYRALTMDDFPGFGNGWTEELGLPSSGKVISVSYATMSYYKGLLTRLSNLEKGVSAVDSAIAELEAANEEYRQQLKDYYMRIIFLAAEKLPEIDKLLDKDEVEKANIMFEELKASYPEFPLIPIGLDGSFAVENLGFGDALIKHTALMDRVAGRLAVMLKKWMESGGLSDEETITSIKSLYEKFREAYEERNDSLLISFLGDDWEAGDGTTLSDLQVNFARTFRTFDEIQYSLQNMKIVKQPDSSFMVTYDVIITSRIYSRNIKHEEKSSVSELVSIENGKAKIMKTLSGRFWYVE
ncbi:MAG: hypothetical protein HY808_00925 [Nitrospirae bacterium]|nr:hypothetical protein [Nitrospirota bacterium]